MGMVFRPRLKWYRLGLGAGYAGATADQIFEF